MKIRGGKKSRQVFLNKFLNDRVSMKCINIALDSFEVVNMNKHSTSIIVGKRETGKTVLAKDLVLNQSIPRSTPCHVYCNLHAYNREYEHFTFKTGMNIINFPDIIREEFPKDSIVLFDDCVEPIPESQHLFAQKDIFSVFTLQTPLCPLEIRKHFDYVFLGYTNNQQDIETMYLLYGRKIFPDLKTFQRVFEWCTTDYTFMVIDNTSDSSKISERVFHFRASL